MFEKMWCKQNNRHKGLCETGGEIFAASSSVNEDKEPPTNDSELDAIFSNVL